MRLQGLFFDEGQAAAQGRDPADAEVIRRRSPHEHPADLAAIPQVAKFIQLVGH